MSSASVLRVVGVDWAVDPRKRGLVGLAFDPSTRAIRVQEVLTLVPDEAVVGTIRSGTYSTVAVDVPFGWPGQFADFAQRWSCFEHRPDLRVPPSGAFTYRRTDHAVRETTGQIALSVSSDRIALAALSWVRLVAAHDLHALVDVHPERPVQRPNVIEVYPAATLATVFDKPSIKHYKDDPAVRSAMLDRLRSTFRIEAPPAELTEALVGKGKHSHAADALVAALTALMYEGVLEQHVRRPSTMEETSDARREGWIFFPSVGRIENKAPSKVRRSRAGPRPTTTPTGLSGPIARKPSSGGEAPTGGP